MVTGFFFFAWLFSCIVLVHCTFDAHAAICAIYKHCLMIYFEWYSEIIYSADTCYFLQNHSAASAVFSWYPLHFWCTCAKAVFMIYFAVPCRTTIEVSAVLRKSSVHNHCSFWRTCANSFSWLCWCMLCPAEPQWSFSSPQNSVHNPFSKF